MKRGPSSNPGITVESFRPPTDNLYKFLALGGLLVVVLACLFPVRWLHELQLESIEVSGEITKLEAEQRYLNQRSEFLQSLIEIRALTAPEADERMQELDSTALAFRQRMQDVRVRETQRVFLANQVRTWKYMIVGIGGAGAVMAILGFTLWYVRVQVYEDRLLHAEAREKGTGDGAG